MPTFRDNLSVPGSSVKNTKIKPAVQIGVHIGRRVGDGMFSVTLFQPVWLMLVLGKVCVGGGVGTVIMQLGRETYREGRNSNSCVNGTHENIHMRKAGERKRKECVIHD